MKAIIIAALSLLVSSSAMASSYQVNGTSGDDEIFIGMRQKLIAGVWTNNGLVAYVNGVTTYLPTAASDTLFVSGSSGNDYIEFLNSVEGNLNISSSVRLVPFTGFAYYRWAAGDSGDDALVGSDFSDNLDGGYGDDTLIGRGGGDTIFGTEGSLLETFTRCFSLTVPLEDEYDMCYGEDGNDTVHCQGYVKGGTGTDVCGGYSSTFSTCETIQCN